MKPIHRYLLAAAIVAIILTTVLAAPTVARSSLAETQAQTWGPGGGAALGAAGYSFAATMADGEDNTTNTTTPTPAPTITTTPTDGTSATHRFEPFTATPAAVPGRIEAEDYDVGGQGWAWYDRTPGNQGGAYREDDVDIETGGSGNVVAFVKSSEWLIYSVDVQEAGDYLATFRASSPWADRAVWVWVDGVLKTRVEVPDTASFDVYEDATATITLPAGRHYIRLEFVRDAQNLDFFSLELAGGPTVTPTPTGNVTPTPTITGNVTPTPTSDGNVTPTPTITGNVTPTPTPANGTAVFTQEEANLQLEWRKLWENHIFWTRMVIINIADTPGGTNESVARLLQNYRDMQDAMRPWYGDAEAEEFGGLLQEHLLIAADLVTAVKANNSTGAAELQARWFENADQIAADLTALNPNWNEQEQQEMWRTHLNVTLTEASVRLSGSDNTDAYDEVHRVGLGMADMFSMGILEQFPDRFGGEKTVTQAELELMNDMRELWTDHSVYTKLYIISSLDDAPDTDAVAARLLQNQADLGDAIRPFYGDATADQLTGLLEEHILIAVEIVDALKANNTTAQADAEARWTANADEIAVFLAGANPHWTEQALKDLLHMHLSTLKEELVARYTQDYVADVAARDRAYDHILVLSDALSAGLIAQFMEVTPTPTPTTNASDLTNQASPLAATITGNQSTTMLQAPAVPIGLERVAGNFTSPLFVADARDGSGRLFLVDQNGYVNIFYMNGTVIDQPFLDIRDRMVTLLPAYDERGLLSIAFHPNFSTNGKVYAYYSAPLRAGADQSWNCTNRLSEFTVNLSSPDVVDTTTERILLEVDKPQTNHNGGILLFGPTDNYLYLTLGDGGRADDTGLGHTPGIGNAQDLTKLLGKVIRIDVDTTSEGLQYGIPADNPFLSNASIPPEIYAYGFRNPAFASFDSGGSNRMFIAMAGQNLFESVLVLYNGGAYPWNIREGTHCFDPAMNRTVADTNCSITSYAGEPLIGPIVELGHDVGNTVVGGVVYRGSNLTSLQQGSYVFGTWSNSFTVGDGTLLVATPPAGLDTTALPDDAASLTPEQNAMWTTSEMTVANNANGRLNTFLRGMYEGTDGEVLVLINQNAGPGITPQNSGEVWRMVDANTPGLVPIGNVSTTPTVTPTPTTTTNVTETPTAEPTATVTTTPALNSSVDLAAQNMAFSQSTITVQAGALVTVNFNNMDVNVPHNLAVYTDASASTPIFQGQIVTGPATTTYTFTAPSTPGTYFFRCDVHPTTMTGTFVVT